MRMARRTKQGLDDVKLTLQRLQRIAIDPAADLSADDGAKANGAASSGSPAIEAARLDAAAKPARAGLLANRNALFGVAGALLVMVGAGTFLLMQRSAHKPRPTAATAVDLPARLAPVNLPPMNAPPASLQGI